MRSPFVRAAGLCVGLTFLTACGDPTAPQEASLTGAYTLSAVDGAPVPALLNESNGFRYLLVSDFLDFDGNGSLHRVRVIRHENTLTSEVTIYSNSFTQDYRVRGDSVEIGTFIPCPPNAFCVRNELGTFTTEQIILTAGQWGDRRLAFRRLVTALPD